jgi:LPS-assembly lipoprotein
MRVVWWSIVLLPLFGNLTACGFQLRAPVQASSLAGQPMQLGLAQGNPLTQPLTQPLTRELLGVGVQLAESANLTLKVSDVVLNRQVLNGKLTEVQLSLSAKFQLTDSKTGEPLSTLRNVLARRSYQYDIATVNTDNQQEGLLEAELYQEVAGRLARQLGTIRPSLPTALVQPD